MLRRFAPLAFALVAAACSTGMRLRGSSIERASYELHDGRVVLQLSLVLENGSSEAVVAQWIEYDVRLEERPVAVGSASVGEAEGVTIEAGALRALDLSLPIARESLPEEVEATFRRRRSVAVRVRGWVHLLGAEAVPFDLVGVLAPATADQISS